MTVRLKIVRGKLTKQSGGAQGAEPYVEIRRSRFIIGGAPDCHMRCSSRSISDHHCELLIDGDDRVYVRDLGSDTGTFVNGGPVEAKQELAAGDQLRVGRLEFEVVVHRSNAAEFDPVADYVSELLVEADQQDRARRLEDPQLRRFQIEPIEPAGFAQVEAPGQRERPPQNSENSPGKLPPIPKKEVADTTVDAARETLRKIFGTKK